jgi:hypothetical protein
MWATIIAVVALGVSIVLAFRSPKQTREKPQVLEVPTAQEGLTIPVLFGTRNFKSPNVVWYGDVTTNAVRNTGGHVTGGKKG